MKAPSPPRVAHPPPAEPALAAAAARRTTTPRWSPLIETVAYIAMVLAADAIWGSGERFLHVQPHPFWLIVLLMAAQYGTREALMATALASVALLAGNLPGQGFDEHVHAYFVRVSWQPVLWMLASFAVGELRGQHRQQHVEIVEQLDNAERRVVMLTKAHQDVTVAKERLETRLAGQLKTATGMFEAARRLETLDPDKVLEGAADLLAVALNAKAFSVFLLERNALVLTAEQGGTEAKALARRFGSNTPLFEAVVGGQRFVTVATPEGEKALAGEGLMAGPLIDPGSGKLIGMLKVEAMSFLDFNLTSVHTFKALCDWIAAAYANAQSHKTSQLVDDTTHLYGIKHLERQTAHLTAVALRFGFDLTLLFFKLDIDDLPDEERRAVSATLGQVAQKVLRRTDLVFSPDAAGALFAALLPGALPEHALVVKRKIVEGLREACGREIPCTTRVRALCRASDVADRTRLRNKTTIEPDMVA